MNQAPRLPGGRVQAGRECETRRAGGGKSRSHHAQRLATDGVPAFCGYLIWPCHCRMGWFMPFPKGDDHDPPRARHRHRWGSGYDDGAHRHRLGGLLRGLNLQGELARFPRPSLHAVAPVPARAGRARRRPLSSNPSCTGPDQACALPFNRIVPIRARASAKWPSPVPLARVAGVSRTSAARRRSRNKGANGRAGNRSRTSGRPAE